MRFIRLSDYQGDPVTIRADKVVAVQHVPSREGNATRAVLILDGVVAPLRVRDDADQVLRELDVADSAQREQDLADWVTRHRIAIEQGATAAPQENQG